MVVFPQALVTALAATPLPLTHGRIGYQTYTKDALPSQVTASGDTAEGPADAPLRPETNEYWKPPSLPATWQFVFGGIKSVNYAGLAGHNLGSCGCSVEAETSMDGATWDALGLEHTPTDDSPIMFLDEERDATRLRLTINGSGLIPSLAVVFVGRTLDFARPIYGGHSPIVLSRETIHQSLVSRGGQYLGQHVQRMGVNGNVRLDNLLAAWYRAEFDRFVEATRSRPYFYAWRPETFPLEVAYLWNTGDISPTNKGKRTLMEVAWKVQGIGWTRNG